MQKQGVDFNFSYTNIRSVATLLTHELISNIQTMSDNLRRFSNGGKTAIDSKEVLRILLANNTYFTVSVSTASANPNSKNIDMLVHIRYVVNDPVTQGLGRSKNITFRFADKDWPEDESGGMYDIGAFVYPDPDDITRNTVYAYGSIMWNNAVVASAPNVCLMVDQPTLACVSNLKAIVQLMVFGAYSDDVFIIDPIKVVNYTECIESTSDTFKDDDHLIEETSFTFVYRYHL